MKPRLWFCKAGLIVQHVTLRLMDRYPIQADPRPQTAHRQVLLGTRLRTVGGQTWTHAGSLTVCLLTTGRTCWLKSTVLSAAQALTWTGCIKNHISKVSTWNRRAKWVQVVHVGGGGVPAHFPTFEVTLNSSRLLCTGAAEVYIVVAHITLLAFLHNMVSTNGVITHWPQENT